MTPGATAPSRSRVEERVRADAASALRRAGWATLALELEAGADPARVVGQMHVETFVGMFAWTSADEDAERALLALQRRIEAPEPAEAPCATFDAGGGP